MFITSSTLCDKSGGPQGPIPRRRALLWRPVIKVVTKLVNLVVPTTPSPILRWPATPPAQFWWTWVKTCHTRLFPSPLMSIGDHQLLPVRSVEYLVPRTVLFPPTQSSEGRLILLACTVMILSRVTSVPHVEISTSLWSVRYLVSSVSSKFSMW
jgi:hypothetical protein